VEKSQSVVVEIFPVLGEAAASVEPSDGALDDPALGFHDEAFDGVGTSDDLDLEVRHDHCDAAVEDRAGIGTVCEQLPQKGKLSEQGGQQQHTAVTVLNVGCGHQCMQQQTKFVDQDVALLALDQLACIEAIRIDGRAPFSALFTLWLSTIQAVGLASRSACSRHFT
jgi:hypothetical protein